MVDAADLPPQNWPALLLVWAVGLMVWGGYLALIVVIGHRLFG